MSPAEDDLVSSDAALRAPFVLAEAMVCLTYISAIRPELLDRIASQL